MRSLRLLALVVCACGPAPRPAVPPAPPPLRPVPAVVAASPAPEPLAYLDATLATLASKYVDPNRFDFRKMLGGALDALEREVAEVIVKTANDRVTVRVHGEHHVFAGDVDSLAELGLRLTEILEFVRAHASPNTDRGELELEAVNGMLRTLDPHTYVISAKEMEDWNVNLSGKFGGIGIVIGVRADRITALEVHANTPAARGGLKAGDHITAINGHSTEALTLDDVIVRLRGDPGTTVELSLDRGGKRVDVPLVRAEIKLPVVTSKLLDGKVGYVAIDRFDAETANELERAMLALRDQGARGWVVDLRDNEGGYLAQAVRATDLFVEYGTIVATITGDKKRGIKKHDIKNATTGGVDTRSPVVVLIGDATASSGEIMAGALKQLDRAVLVGRTTFGKGSVQTLEDAPLGGKLKITIAEYVAAHDISIQAVGIAPDIELVPARVPAQLASAADRVQLIPPRPFREVDLGDHLTTAQAIDRDQPIASIPYLQPASGAPDFEIDFARRLVLTSKARTRNELLRHARRFVPAARISAERAIIAALGAIGVDWRPGRTTTKLAAGFASTVTGDAIAFHADVTNTGTTPAWRVHARAESDDPALDGLEIALGRIAPRSTKRGTAWVKLPRGSASRTSALRWKLVGLSAETAQQVTVTGIAYPSFAFTTQLVDDNDGVVRHGEALRVRVRVTNRGPGAAPKAVATLKSLVGERVLVDRGRVELGALGPNQSKDVELAFQTAARRDAERVSLQLAVGDADLGAAQTQKLAVDFDKRVARWELTPPRVRIDATPLETTADRVRVTGRAEDEQRVGDVYIMVSNRAAKVRAQKVFYAAGTQRRLEFAADVPLAPGANRIVVVAREHDAAETVRAVWVFRR